MKKFTAGMIKDPERVDQPEGTYRDALNANLYYQKGAVVNEQGTTAFTNVGGFSIDNIIGQCALKDGRIVLFFNYEVNGTATSAISIVDPADKTNDVIYRNPALNFKPSNTIEATSKIDANGETLVYFTDNYIKKETEPLTGIQYITEYNPPRVINITRQEKSVNPARLYGNADYTVEKLDLFMNAGNIPEFKNVVIEEGGGVVSGTYHLALAYVDEDLNRTNYLATSNPVHLVTEHEDAIPTETITGDPQGSQSNKSITWQVNVPVPSNYTHVQPVIIQRFGGGTNQESSEFAYQLDIIAIPAAGGGDEYVNVEVTYTGLEQLSSASVAEVVVDSIRYETGKSFVQLDGRLYISNLRARGDIGYQRFANNITVSPIATTVPRFDPKKYDTVVLNRGYNVEESGILNNDFAEYRVIQKDFLNDGFFNSSNRKGYKDVNMHHKYRGYRRSETYAFYISFVLKDGSETYAYHIPGRAPKEINVYADENSSLNNSTVTGMDAVFNLDLQEFKDRYPDAKLHEITDTQYLLDTASTEMSYWENADEIYPDTEDFEIWSAAATGSPVNTNSELKNRKVRHHKMPPNKNRNFSYIGDLENSGDEVSPSSLFGADAAVGVDGLKLKESIKILGVQFSNIPIPTFIADQVQGFKIYYAKREQQEKTIIGQSIVMPAWYEDSVVRTKRMTDAAHGPYESAWFLRGYMPWHRDAFTSLPEQQIPTLDGSKPRKIINTFTFHDFNLLKNKHTLSGVSHIDVQKVLTMNLWSGGNRKKPARLANDESVNYFLDTDWTGSDVGTTGWYNWWEEGAGNSSGDTAGTSDDEVAETGSEVSRYWTSVFIAMRYNNPNDPNTLTNNYYNAVHDSENNFAYWLNNYQTIFTIDPNSRTYLTAPTTHLKVAESGAFKGVDFLGHHAGESCMVFSLSSGLPAQTSRNRLSSLASNQVAKWWDSSRFAWYGSEDGLDLQHVNASVDSTGPNAEYASWPTLYLVNLCVYKTNVYKPFDQQRLVWTGYYQPINNDAGRNKTLYRVSDDNQYLYKTDTVFGGDTYISRYSFRTTSQDFGTCFRSTGGAVSTYAHVIDRPHMWQGYNSLFVSNYNSTTASPKLYRPSDPYASLFQFMCESDDLLGFRHQGDNAEGVSVGQSKFFDAAIASDVLFEKPEHDHTKPENLLYMNNYSAVQDIKVTVPLPKKLFNPTFYPTRTIRSSVDSGGIQDKYRFFAALDYKDIPRNRGEITKVFTLGSILYMHTERSLFVTRGRQQLGLSDNTQAFVGSGDIFEQNPDEMIPTTEGYGGTDCQFASLTTRFGQFFVNRRDRKVYMMGENITEVSAQGMEKWFLENIPYVIESYLNLDELTIFDSPTNHFGFNSTYDPKYKRIILSKKELIPIGYLLNILTNYTVSSITATDDGISLTGNFPTGPSGKLDVSFTDTDNFRPDGWTVSYYPEIKVWGSRHSYLPTLFSNNQREFYGLTNTGTTNVWEHSNLTVPGNFYNNQYNFEFEFIDNAEVGKPKIFSALRYWVEVVQPTGVGQSSVLKKHTSPGFDSFYVYNSTQISGDGKDSINYLSNARLVNNFWYINQFRDKSIYELNTSDVLANGELNVQDEFNQGTTTTLFNQSMFTQEGVVNGNYINPNKSWYNQKRFVDHYLGIRLINNNLDGNLIYLYSAGTKFRQSFR